MSDKLLPKEPATVFYVIHDGEFGTAAIPATAEDITDEMVERAVRAVEKVDAMVDDQIAALLDTDGYEHIVARAALSAALCGGQ